MPRIGSQTVVCVAVLGALLLGLPVRAAEPAKKGLSASRKKATELLAQYFSDDRPSAAELKSIRKLIADMGADDFGVREAASKNVLKYGRKALPALKEAAKSKDAEVVQRAEAAISAIEGGDRRRQILAELRKVKKDALAVIDGKIKDLQATCAEAKKVAAKLKAADKNAEALKKLAEAKAAVGQCLALAELRKTVEADDPLAEIETLIKQGKQKEAMIALQNYMKRVKAKGGKMTPAEQRRLQELVQKIYAGRRGVRFGVGIN